MRTKKKVTVPGRRREEEKSRNSLEENCTLKMIITKTLRVMVSKYIGLLKDINKKFGVQSLLNHFQLTARWLKVTHCSKGIPVLHTFQIESWKNCKNSLSSAVSQVVIKFHSRAVFVHKKIFTRSYHV